MTADIAITAGCVIRLADALAFDPDALEDADLDERVRLLAQVDDARKALQSVYSKIERAVIQGMGDKRYTVDGYDLEIRRAKAAVVTDMPALVGQVYTAALDSRVVDEETGEIEDRGEAVHRVYVDAFGLHNKSATFRKGTLTNLGIDVDQLQSFEGFKPPTIQWHNKPERDES